MLRSFPQEDLVKKAFRHHLNPKLRVSVHRICPNVKAKASSSGLWRAGSQKKQKTHDGVMGLVADGKAQAVAWISESRR